MAGFKEEAGFVPKSYAEVPWHRKLWAVNLFTLFCAPVLLAILLTGNAYYEKGGVVETIGGKRRWAHIIVAGWITLAAVVSTLRGK